MHKISVSVAEYNQGFMRDWQKEKQLKNSSEKENLKLSSGQHPKTHPLVKCKRQVLLVKVLVQFCCEEFQKVPFNDLLR